MPKAERPVYGLMAEFERPEALLAAVERVRREGYRCFEAYTPQPVEGLSDAMGLGHSRVSFIVLMGALSGMLLGYALQLYASADYPVNVGGRPVNSWPIFIPTTFEVAVLLGAIFAVLGFFGLSGLPCPYHPVFNVPRFARASRDRFFLVIEKKDRRFDPGRTREFLASLEPAEVYEVAE